MSSPITSGAFAKALMPGVRKWWGDSYTEYPLIWPKMFQTETSTKGFEEDVQSTGFGLLAQKPEGTAVVYDTASQGFIQRYTHITYALGFVVTEEAIDDDQYMVIARKRSRALGFSMRQTQEVVAANVLNRAFTAAYAYGDGKELIATDHPNFTGGTFSNELSTGADLSEAAIEQLSIQIMDAQDDRGLRINIMPRSLIVPTALSFEAHRILKSALQNDTGNNAVNAIRDMGMFPDGIIVNPYLTDADAWFIRTNCPDGLMAFKRREPGVAEDNDFDTSNAKFKGSFRASWGATDARGIYGSMPA